MKLKVFSCLAAILALACAGPIGDGEDSCSTSCTGSHKFGYRPGIAYEFDYIIKTSTGVKGTSEGLSSLEVTATVQVEAVSKCDFILKVSNTQVYELDTSLSSEKVLSAGSERFQRDFEQHDLKFSFQDGVIDRVCASPDEAVWTLNVKRGLLSVFQNSMDNFNQEKDLKETDVTGTCDTEYTTMSAQSGHVVKKTKDLQGCTGRNGFRTTIHSVPYGTSSDFQSLPVMNSNQQCVQDISSDGLLNSARCVETHLFKPFSREGSGAVTEILQSLEFVQETTPTAAATHGILTNYHGLLYEHHAHAIKLNVTVKDLEKVLQEICENTHMDIRPESTALFSKLVQTMKTFDTQSLREVYQRLNVGHICGEHRRTRKFFLDAIPVAGSVDAMRLMTELILTEDVTGPETDVWLTTLSFVQSPTKDMMRELTPLISLRNGNALLSVSSLVHVYCSSTSCDGDMVIHGIMNALKEKIAVGCFVDEDNIQMTILSLRAIGNTGQSNQTVQSINSCTTRSENPTEVRLAAIDAFRHFPCNVERPNLMMMFANKTEDPEVRIAAFLASMQCADEQTIDIVKNALEEEEVNQVGSFVWSHLKNLNETFNRHRQNLRNILTTVQLGNKFNLTKTKFSHNFEKSIFLQQYNIGSSFESNVIWSPTSFVPRSLSANLTVDLFGRSVNLLDIGGRFEGLDTLLESYFGPNGQFSKGGVNEISRHIAKSIRFQKLMDSGNKFHRATELKGSFYARVFGQELGYRRFDGRRPIFGEEFNVLELLISMSKNQEHKITQNVNFLDSSVIVPTGAGFPLSLTANGAATVDLQLSGNVDLRKLFISPRSMSINGVIQPSASVEVSGLMSLDAFVTRSGTKVVSNLHTSTVLQGKIDYAEGQKVELDLDMPREKMEILSFKTAVFIIKNNSQREQTMIPANKQSHRHCTGNVIGTFIGLQLCGELEYPNASLQMGVPHLPLTGPMHMKVELLKTDRMTGYKFEAKFLKTKQAISARIGVDTPGSDIDRRIGADLAVDMLDPSVTVNLFSPWKNATFNGALQNTRSLRRLFGRVKVDSSHDYYVNAEMLRSRRGHSYVYTPRLELLIPMHDLVRLEGNIEYLPFKTVDMDVMLSGVRPSPVIAKVTLNNKSMIRSILGSISFVPGKTFQASAGLHKIASNRAVKYRPFMSLRTPKREVLMFDGSAEYRPGKTVTMALVLRKVTKERFTMFCKIRKIGSKKNQRYETKADVKSPYINTKVQSSVVLRGGKALITRSTVNYVIPTVIMDKITINGKANLALTKYLTQVISSLNVQFKKKPEYNTDVSSELTHNMRNTRVGIDIRYGEDKTNTDNTMTLHTTVVHRLTWSEPTLSVNSTYQHPAKGLDIQFNAGYTHNGRSMGSSARYSSRHAEPFALTVRVKRGISARKALFGSILLSYSGRNIKISNDLLQEDDGVYTNRMIAEWEPSKKNIISTVFRMPTKRELQCSIDVHFVDFRRMRFSGRYLMDINNISALSELSLAGRKYALSHSLVFQSREIRFSGDAKFPPRHIVLEINLMPRMPLYTIQTNAMLSDMNKPIRRLHLLALVNVDSLGFSILKKSPLGQFEADFNLHGDYDFRSHTNILWGTLKGLTINGTIRNDGINGNTNIKGIVKVISPFRGYRFISMVAIHIADRERYLTKFNVHTKSGKKLSASIIIRKPLSLSYLMGDIRFKSTLKHFQALSLECVHILDRGLSTMTKFSWNRNAIEVNLKGHNRGSKYLRDISGTFGVKSTSPHISSISVTGEHVDDGRKFNNKFRLLRNGKGIKYEGEMLHDQHGWQLMNSGFITCLVLSKKFHSSWNHINTPSEIITQLNSTIGKRNLKIGFNMDNAMSIERGTLNLRYKITGDVLPNIEIFAMHTHDRERWDNSFTLRRRTKLIFSTANKIQLNGIGIDSSHIAQFMNKVYLLKAEANYLSYPYSGLVEFQWPNKERVHVSFMWNDIDGLYNGNVVIRTPKSKDFHLTLQQAYASEELVSTVAASHRSRIIVFVENRYRWDDVKFVHMEVSTRYKILRTMRGNVTLSGSLNNFHAESHVNIQYRPNKYIDLDAVLSNIRKIEGTLLLRIPQRDDIRFVYIQNGNPVNIHMELQYHPRKRFETDLKIAFGENAEFVMMAKTPFTQNLVAILNHLTFPSRFASHVEVKYGYTKVVFGDVSFGWKNNITGSIALKSAYIENVSAGFYYKRAYRFLKTHLELQSRSKSVFTGDIELSKDKTFAKRALLSFALSGFKRFNAALVHRGRLTNFNTNVNFKYGNAKFDIIAMLAVNPNLDASVEIVTPLKGFKTLHASVHHEGSRKAFDTKAIIGIGKSTIVGTTRFTLRPVSLEINFQTPFSKYKQRRLFYTHSGSWTQFQCRAEILFNSKQFHGDIQFSLKPLTGSLSFISPFSGYETLTMKVSHEANHGDHQCFLDVSLPRERKLTVSANLDLSVTSTRSVSLTIVTPFKKYDKIDAGFSISGSLRKFECRSLIGIGKKKIIGFARFDVVDVIAGEIAFMTPFVGYRRLSIGFQYVGASINFKLRTNVLVVDSVYEVEFTYSALSDYEALLVLRFPNKEDIRLSTTISRKRRKIVTEAGLTYGRTDLASANFKCTLSPKIKGSGTFESNWTKPAKLFLVHRGSLQDFQTVIRVEHDSDNIVLNTKLNSTDGISGRFLLKSPFSSIEQIDASILHSTRRSRYQYHFESGSNSKKTTDINIGLDLSSGKDMTVDMLVPFYNMKHIIFLVNYTNENNNLKGRLHMSIDQEAVECDVAMNMSNEVIGRIIVQTPWYKNLTGTLTYSSQFSALQSHTGRNYNDGSQFQTDVAISTESPTIFTVSLDTPFAQTRHIECSIMQQGTLRQFSSDVDIVFNEHRLAGDIDVNFLDGINARGSLITSFTDDLIIALSHNGTLAHMISKVELMHGQAQHLFVNANCEFPSNIDLNISVHTALGRFNSIQMQVSHNGWIHESRTSGLVVYNTNKKAELKINLANATGYTGLIAFESPFTSEVNASFRTHQGEYAAELFHKDVELVFAKLSVNDFAHAGEGTLLVRTFFKSLRNVQITLSNNLTTNGLLRIQSSLGELFLAYNYRRDTLVTYAELLYGDKLMACDLDIDLNNKTYLSFAIRNSSQMYDFISGSVDYRNTNEKVTNHVFLRTNPLFLFDTNIAYSSFRKFNASSAFQSQIAGYEHLYFISRHALSSDSLDSHFEASYQPDEKFELEVLGSIRNDINGQFGIRTPLQGYEETLAAFRTNVQPNPFIFDGKLKHNRQNFVTNVTLSMTSGNVSIQTPYLGYEHQSFAFSHDITPDHLSVFLAASRKADSVYGMTVDMGLPNGVVYIQSPISGYEEISAIYGNEIQSERILSHAKITYNTRKSIELALNCSLQDGSLIVGTPIRGYENVSVTFLNIYASDMFANKLDISVENGNSRGYSVYINNMSSKGFEVNITLNAILPHLDVLQGHLELCWATRFVYIANLTASVDGHLHELSITARPDPSLETNFPAAKTDTSIPVIVVKVTTRNKNQTNLEFALNKNNGCLLSLEIQKPYSLRFLLCETKASNISEKKSRTTNELNLHSNLTNSWSVMLAMESAILFQVLHKSNDKYLLQPHVLHEHWLVQLGSGTVQVDNMYSSGDSTIQNTSMTILSGEEALFKLQGSISSLKQSKTMQATWTFSKPGQVHEVKTGITYNSGNTLFDGIVELQNPEDVDKDIVLYARVEDDLTDIGHNVSFMFGVKHLITTVNVRLLSYVGYINDVYFTGTELRYLNADNENKDVSVKGTVNKAMTEVAFEILSPIQSMKLSGEVYTESPYGLSVHNMVGETPMVLELNLDPTQPYIHGRIEIPPRVFALEVYFINDSSMRAAIYSDNSSGRVNDITVTMCLHSSRKISTSINWRPALVQDITNYGLGLTRTLSDMSMPLGDLGNSVSDEIDFKYNYIRQYIFSELGSFLHVSVDEMRKLQQSIVVFKTRIHQDYRMDDLNMNLAVIDLFLDSVLQHYTEAVNNADMFSNWMETSAAVHISYPNKAVVDVYIQSGSSMLETVKQDLLRQASAKIRLFPRKLQDGYVSALQYYDYVRDSTLSMADLIDYRYTVFRQKWATVLTTINTVASLSGENITGRIEYIKQAFQDLQSTGVVQFDPVIGNIETAVYLPIDLDYLKSIPYVYLTKYYAGMASMMESVREASIMFHDFLDVDLRSLIPPFTASASISNGLVRTFDGTTYTFGGKCEYLLAGDLTDGNFSIYMENQGKRRVKIILTTHQHTIQLSPRKQVRIDGSLVFLPYRNYDVYVTKIGSTIILTGRGFSLQHNIETESYDVSLSGWYFGKTGGLLGTYDNEPYNDLMTSTGGITRNATEFSKTWRLNEHCK